MKEFKVNKSITLKLENNKTNIYINDELFLQCKFLLLNIPTGGVNSPKIINSIDEAAEELDSYLEVGVDYKLKMSAEDEYWAHSSNLQAWSENEYDTRILHSNLSFSLLKKLSESGDLLAKRKYKEEIAKRFIYGNNKIQDFLLEENYLNDLSKEELLSVVNESDIIFELERILRQNLEINTSYYPYPQGIVIESAEIKWLSLQNCSLKKIPELVKELKKLKGLILRGNSLATLPNWIGEFKWLEWLDVSNNKLKDLPDSIGNLRTLKRFELQNNKLKDLPDSIGDLIQLEVLSANGNLIEKLPDSIGNLALMKNLSLGDNVISTIPKSMGNMISLKILDLSKNPLQKLPNSISRLENLESLYLRGITQSFSNLKNDLRRKKIIIIK